MAVGSTTRKSVPKPAFSQHMSTLKTQTYHESTSSRGSSSSYGPLEDGQLSETAGLTPDCSIRTLAWSSSGSRIATGSTDRIIRVWNPERPQTKSCTDLRGHTGLISYVLWNPTNDYELASCSGDGTVRLWDVRTRACRSDIKTGNEPFTMSWSADGTVLMVGRKDDALLPIFLPKVPHTQPSSQAPMPQTVQTNQTMFSHSGKELLVSTGNGGVKVLDYPSMDLIETLHGHTSSCLCLDIDPTGKWIAIGGSDALISLWDTTDGFVKNGLDRMIGPVRSVSFSFDGAYLCGGSDEGTGIMVAHVDTVEYVHTIPTAHPAACVAWHPQRYWLAYSGDPQGLKIVGAAGVNA